MNKVGLLLEETKGLVLKGWLQKAFAENTWGKPVAPASDAACSWCLLGAIERASFKVDNLGGRRRDVMDRGIKLILSILCPDESNPFTHPTADAKKIMAWNDAPSTKKEDVLGILDQAIFFCCYDIDNLSRG